MLYGSAKVRPWRAHSCAYTTFRRSSLVTCQDSHTGCGQGVGAMVHGVFVLVKVWGCGGKQHNITSYLRYTGLLCVCADRKRERACSFIGRAVRVRRAARRLPIDRARAAAAGRVVLRGLPAHRTRRRHRLQGSARLSARMRTTPTAHTRTRTQIRLLASTWSRPPLGHPPLLLLQGATCAAPALGWAGRGRACCLSRRPAPTRGALCWRAAAAGRAVGRCGRAGARGARVRAVAFGVPAGLRGVGGAGRAGSARARVPARGGGVRGGGVRGGRRSVTRLAIRRYGACGGTCG